MSAISKSALSSVSLKSYFEDLLQIILNSYSQIFFATHSGFAWLILLVTFSDFYTGLFGLLSVVVAAVAGLQLGFNKITLKKGLLGFNSLLVGLGLGVYFSPSVYLVMIVIMASLFSFFISVSLQGVIGKYGLPFLSLPFILALWVFMLATPSFQVLGINERGIFTINELYEMGGQSLVQVYEYFNNLSIPNVIRAYFISLSAILFQYSVLSGFLIALGLLFFSRIAFSLSLIGFFLAYGFYHIIGAEITIYDYSFFGFNYILSSIAIGGFFLIPSRNAYLWMILLIPFVAVLTISMNLIFITFKLPIYSLPFNLIVFLFIYTLKFREKYSYSLSEVYYQHNAPEKNLYIFLNNKERFRHLYFTPVKLPFFGKWKVSQGPEGAYTHQGIYRHAWDFVIEGPDGKPYKNDGDYPEDYYCYNKPVTAAADGVVEHITDGIEDNIIGKPNLVDNWGNTVIIKHQGDIYTKVSHLKKGSIELKKGDAVKYGQVLGRCGNSGRSPYPHLHFQIQAYPFIGSQTLDYPLSHYITHEEGRYTFKTHTKPMENDWVSNVEINPLLSAALELIPGQKLSFTVVENKLSRQVEWEVRVNELNQSYMYCKETGAQAFFENDQSLFYFTYFEGSKKSDLFVFFTALFRIQKGFYKDLVLEDQFPLYLTYPKKVLWFHDFVSPFKLFIKSAYKLKYTEIDDLLSPSKISLESEMTNYWGHKIIEKKSFNMELDTQGLVSLKLRSNQKELEFKR